MNDVDDVGAAEFVLLGNGLQVQFGCQANGGREGFLPQNQPLGGPGHGEMHYALESAGESIVHVALEIGAQDAQPAEFFHSLEQVRHLLVGKAVVRIADVGALAKQRVGFVKKQYPVLVFGPLEEGAEVFFRLADVLRHQRGEVNAVHVVARELAQKSGGHRLARAGRPVEQGAEAGLDLALHLPVVEQGVVMFDPGLDLAEVGLSLGAEHEVVPFEFGFQLLRRETAAQARRGDVAEGEQFDKLWVEDEFAARGGFAGLHVFEVQDALFDKKMLGAEHALDVEAPLQVAARAAQQEQRGVACRQKTPIVRPFHPAEGGKIAALREILLHHFVEHLRLHVRHQPGDEGHELVHREPLVLHEAGEGRVVVLHDGHGRHSNRRFAKIFRQAQPEEVAEEGEGEEEVGGHGGG